MVRWMDGPHDEILRNLVTSKTGYVEIASRLGFGINLVLNLLSNVFMWRLVSSSLVQLVRTEDIQGADAQNRKWKYSLPS
jgi:hypothetical protein